MPVMQVEINDILIDVELNQYGEVMGTTDAITGLEVTYLHAPEIGAKIDDFMRDWHEELREYKLGRGRDRLNEN